MKRKILIVDDSDAILYLLQRNLEKEGFDVTPALGVPEALRQISSQQFDALITDLHMPGPGDGFTVVSAMRHSQPEALTLVVSGFPDVKEAMAAILLQADEVLVKPFDISQLTKLILDKTQSRKVVTRAGKETVASVLERDVLTTIQQWLTRVEAVKELAAVKLSSEERMAHLPEIIRNIVTRLRLVRDLEAVAAVSPAAIAHGQDRCRQGYSAPMIVQESRILQVSIFETIQRNLATLDFSLVLPDIMLLADEVDSQLTQSIESFLKAQQCVG